MCMVYNMENNSLTSREMEVLEYVAKGMTNKEIAQTLSITHHTVKAHVASIIKKVGVKNRLDAVIKCVMNGTIKVAQ